MAKIYTLSQSERRIYAQYAQLALPRHTSFPISPVWTSEYTPRDFGDDLTETAENSRPLSLYVHIPYCEQLCYYCACTKEIVPRSKRATNDPSPDFLRGLDTEAKRVGNLVNSCVVHQIHLGGGSPTFLAADNLQRLWQILERQFRRDVHAEVAIEVDPRITSREQLQTLRELGFNRISLGIQDFNENVQRAVNRIQPYDLVERFMGWCRELEFDSINFDLIYGLPYQTRESIADTIEKTIALGPDRITFYRLAVLPDMFRWQKTFSRSDLPSGELTLDMNLLAINMFIQAGYEFLGLDHFGRPAEDLAQAHKNGTLRRNFQGMTTGKHLDVVGLGPSAISQLDHAFAQNEKESSAWQQAIETDLATCRGLHLSHDDRLRRELLQQLYGNGTISKSELEIRFNIRFDDYFSNELQSLRILEADGLVELQPEEIRLTEVLGRLLVRVTASVFDRYLPPNAFREGLPSNLASKVG